MIVNWKRGMGGGSFQYYKCLVVGVRGAHEVDLGMGVVVKLGLRTRRVRKREQQGSFGTWKLGDGSRGGLKRGE